MRGKKRDWPARVRQAREDLPRLLGESGRWTQAQLAEVMGLSGKNHVALWERGERQPSRQAEVMLDYLYAMCERGIDPRTTDPTTRPD